jgi:hypothetical protein
VGCDVMIRRAQLGKEVHQMLFDGHQNKTLCGLPASDEPQRMCGDVTCDECLFLFLQAVMT